MNTQTETAFCIDCGGPLLGTELVWGTCGHCGHRYGIPQPIPETEPRPERIILRSVAAGVMIGPWIGMALIGQAIIVTYARDHIGSPAILIICAAATAIIFAAALLWDQRT